MALDWGDVDPETRRITVQRSFDGPTKSDRMRYVPILDVLLPVLREWRLRNPDRLVFPNRDGAMQCESASIFQEIFHRVLYVAQFPKVRRNGMDQSYVRFHDLRHTFASHRRSPSALPLSTFFENHTTTIRSPRTTSIKAATARIRFWAHTGQRTSRKQPPRSSETSVS